jgi:hypothetical protein
MLKIRLDADDTYLIFSPRWADLGAAWQVALLALLLIVPLALILYLCRYELRLISRGNAAGLLMLRLVMLFVLWFTIGMQPHFAEIRIEETPSRVRVAVDLSSSMNVVDLRASAMSRRKTVARLLGPDGSNLLQRLADRHQVEIIGFHQQAMPLSPAQLLEKLSDSKNTEPILGTDLTQALAPTPASRDNPLLGIILLSDGMHNMGPPPFARAEESGKQRIPLYPVAIGPREPPSDLLILDVQAPTKVFKGGMLPIEVRCKVSNLAAEDMTVELQFDGKPIEPDHRQMIAHRGKDDVYTVRFQAKPDAVGTHTYTVKAFSKAQTEVTLANNVATRYVRVMDDKAKVLLVDGEARWEYHYLATALARDTTIQLERVVFTQPRIGAIKEAELEKVGFAMSRLPEVKKEAIQPDPLMDFDCIVLGDVAPEQLPLADRKRLERFVGERGGTLILVAGKRNLPMEYIKQADDPLAKLIPISDPKVMQQSTGFTLAITNEGKLRPFLQLEPDNSMSPWPSLPKHFWGVVGKRKPAATVLLAPVTDEKEKADSETGIFVQQNYGFGRVLFLGIDSTWRWRFRVGDTYHHRFWGQLARWSAADKILPAGNRWVRYGPVEPVYQDGQDVEIAVRLNETLPPLKSVNQAKVKLYRQHDGKSEELIAVVALAANARQANLLEAKIRDLPAATYRVELDIAAFRDQLAIPSDDAEAAKQGRDLFRVLPRVQQELLDLSTNFALLQNLAERSDGKLYTPENVEELLQRLARRIERKEYRDETKPWRDEPMAWWMMGLLVGLLCCEWVWRKWVELP